MKVRCVNLLNVAGRPVATSPWLTVGAVYHVLSIMLLNNETWQVRIATDGDGALGLFPLRQFEVVSAAVPPSWVVSSADDCFELAPQEWRIRNCGRRISMVSKRRCSA